MSITHERNTIDVDVGGTFTDMVMTLDGVTSHRKVQTTPYDLSVGFMQVIEEAADEAGMSLTDLVSQIHTVRYSTTVAMNRLLERSGPRVVLITTEGHEDATLIGKGAQWIDGTRLDERRALPHQQKPMPIVPRELIAGVKERIDATGAVLRPLDEDDVREKVRTLVDRGARAFVVSLLWSFVNPAHERRVKQIIREEYRDYHVGYVPVILSSEVVSRLGE
ncbi:MAG TPA: hydantoinase/oxoprolinase N-terminal domain-containing protein, partial [Solirubrobacteraceae bacterium]|nr:hydantoinase/oxoprolinase N-terminal domain-containing protein [Solirubrobacteraceae bacterium]